MHDMGLSLTERHLCATIAIASLQAYLLHHALKQWLPFPSHLSASSKRLTPDYTKQCCCYDSNISPTYRRRPVLRLEYFSDIPRTSGRTPDVQLRAIDATLCIIGHLAPNLGECPDVFLFCYNSNISLISCGRPTLRNGHGIFALSDNSRPTRPSGPMVSSFVTIQIFL